MLIKPVPARLLAATERPAVWAEANGQGTAVRPNHESQLAIAFREGAQGPVLAIDCGGRGQAAGGSLCRPTATFARLSHTDECQVSISGRAAFSFLVAS